MMNSNKNYSFANFLKLKEQKSISPMKLLADAEVSEGLKYHLDNNLSLCENVFRIYSKAYFDLINETRELYNKNLIEVNDQDADLLETDIGEVIEHNGKTIYLDAPFLDKSRNLNESKKSKKKNPPLNKPVRTPSGPKKFKVYVKTPSGRIKMVRFGDSKASGLSIKNDSPARAKSFRARHKCHEKKDRTTPGYWSCNVARYAKSLGLKSSRPW
jgi:hypothetical protein